MKRQRVEIFNVYGERIYVAHVVDAGNGLAGEVLEKFHLPYAQLPAMNFTGCVMYLPLLNGANLSFCNFTGADLSGANFEEAILRGAIFTGTKMTASAFGDFGSIVGADLTGADLSGSVFRGVKYSSATVFPRGYDPFENGLVLIDED